MSSTFKYIEVVTTAGKKLSPKVDFEQVAAGVLMLTAEGYCLASFTHQQLPGILQTLEASREVCILNGNPEGRNNTDIDIQEISKAIKRLDTARRLIVAGKREPSSYPMIEELRMPAHMRTIPTRRIA